MYPTRPKNVTTASGTVVIDQVSDCITWTASGQCQLPPSWPGRVIELINGATGSAEISIIGASNTDATYSGRTKLYAGDRAVVYCSGTGGLTWTMISHIPASQYVEMTERHTDMMNGYPIEYGDDDYCIMRFIPTRDIYVRSVGIYLGEDTSGTYKSAISVYTPDGLTRVINVVTIAAPDSNGWQYSSSTDKGQLYAGTEYKVLYRNYDYVKNVASINWGISGASQSGSGMTTNPSTLSGLLLTPTSYRHLISFRNF